MFLPLPKPTFSGFQGVEASRKAGNAVWLEASKTGDKAPRHSAHLYPEYPTYVATTFHLGCSGVCGFLTDSLKSFACK